MVKEMKTEREIKNIEILDLIRKKGSISRSDISRITGINMVSVSNYIREYMEKRLVLEKGFDVSTGGRKPELIELNVEKNFVAGMDINPSEIRCVAASIAMKVVEKDKVSLKGLGKKDIADSAFGLLEAVLKRSNISKGDVGALGIGVSDKEIFPEGDNAELGFGVTTFVKTAAFSAAFGETKMNPEAEDKDLLYLYRDTGYGVVIKKGVLLDAASDDRTTQSSDELKYLRPWGNALEIARSAKREVSKGVGTKIVDIVRGGVEDITIDVVIEAARVGDRVALDIIGGAGINLGLRAAYLINLFRPEIVVAGGGIEKAGGLILDPMRKMAKRMTLARSAGVKIVPSVLGEYSVSLGAASLAARQVYIKA